MDITLNQGKKDRFMMKKLRMEKEFWKYL